MTTQPADQPSAAGAAGRLPVWREPTDAELCGLWPDPFAGPPDGRDAWLASLSADELEALAEARAAETGPAAGRVPAPAGFTHRDPGDPDAARRRAGQARGDARVEAWQEGSGNGAIAGRELPPAEMIAAGQRIAAIARALKAAGATGSLDQLRAAVFTALLTGRDPETLAPQPDTTPAGPAGGGTANNTGTGPGPADGLPGLAGSVNLTMPLATWLGRADAPGEAAGLGPPGAGWLTALRFAGTRRLHPPPAGTRLPARPRAPAPDRDPAPDLRRTRLPAPRPPLRHRSHDPFDQGGRTCECNGSPQCRQHHRARQAPGWRLTQPEPGVLVWTTPSGRSYTVHPDTYPI